MRPKFISIQTIYAADDWREGEEFYKSAMRARVGGAADEQGLAIIGHEEFEYAWMRADHEEDGSLVYRGVGDNLDTATHVRVTIQRQAVTREVRL